jgi:hypothetical protein
VKEVTVVAINPNNTKEKVISYINMMLRWMCGIMLLKDKGPTVALKTRLYTAVVLEVLRIIRLKWFHYVERKAKNDWASICRDIEVACCRCRGE